MKVIDFLNDRTIGKKKNTVEYRPNFDNLILRLACKEQDVLYSSFAEGLHVPPFSCKFRRDKQLDLLAVANEEGEIILYDTDTDKGTIKSFTAHNNAIFDICWLPDKNHLITGSGDHRACLFDMNTYKTIGSFNRHTASIKSVDVCPNDTALFATGSRDGTICIWDTRDKCGECGNARDKPSICIQPAHNRNLFDRTSGKKCSSKIKSISSVSAIAFQDQYNLASAGVEDGVVKIWDLRKTYISKPTYVPSPRYQMKYMDGKTSRHGCTSLVFDSSKKKLYGCSTVNKIFMFDCHLYSDASVIYEGFRCDTYFIKIALSPDDQYLLSGSSNGKAYVWKTSKPGVPLFEFPGHNSEVTAVAWGSHDVTKLVTCGDDNKVLVWKTISDENPEPRNEIFTEAAAYKICDKSINADVPLSQPSTANNTHNFSTPSAKTQNIKSITSFFQPLSASTSSPFSNSSSDSSFFSSSFHESNSHESTITSPIQVLSPSKIVNQSNISPESRLLNSRSQGKENHLMHSAIGLLGGQSKRKSITSESTPKLQKMCGKRKRTSRPVKKQKSNSEGTITSYFSVSVSPVEEN